MQIGKTLREEFFLPPSDAPPELGRFVDVRGCEKEFVPAHSNQGTNRYGVDGDAVLPQRLGPGVRVRPVAVDESAVNSEECGGEIEPCGHAANLLASKRLRRVNLLKKALPGPAALSAEVGQTLAEDAVS